MKRIFLALLAVAAMVGCESNLDWPSKIEQKYNFAFDEKGVCYSTNTEGITHAEFAEEVVGYGWKEISSYKIFENGQISSVELMLDGDFTGYRYFETEEFCKHFYIHTFPQSGQIGDQQYVYKNIDYVFDSSKIYFDDDYTYLILSVKGDVMECIWKYNRFSYAFLTLKRMTPEELDAHLQKFSIDYDEAYPKEEESEYKFAFDSDGVCYSQVCNGITQDEFESEVMGYGWQEIAAVEILESGKVLKYSYYLDLDGASLMHLYFGEEGVLTSFYESSAVAPEQGNKGFQETAYTYENSGLYNDWCKPSYYYMILEVSEDEMVLLMCRDRARESNDWTYTYTLNCYNRMTPEQFEEYQQTYTRKWGEE